MLDQFDLFSVASDSEKENSHSHTSHPLAVAHKASHKMKSNEGLPVQSKCNDTPPIRATSELFEFALKYAHRIWPKGGEHKKRSLAQTQRFCFYLDYADLAITDFEGRHTIDFLDELVKEGLSKASANRYAASLSSVFGYAFELKLITAKPHIPFFHEEETRIKTYTRNQIGDFIAYCKGQGDHWMADIIMVAANSGMRKGEIIKVGNPHPKHGATLSRDDKSYTIHKCKNGKPRTLPLNDMAFEALCRLEDGLVHEFTHRKFYSRWSVLRQVFKLDNDDVFHVIRHTYASILANEANANIFVMRDMLGHLDIKTTQRYTHPDQYAQKKLVDSVSAVGI